MTTRKPYTRTPPAEGLAHARDVIAATGLSYRQLDYWCSVGLARPAHEAEGHGSTRWFTLAEVQRLTVMAGLVDAGFMPVLAAVVADHACADVAPSSLAVVPVDIRPGLRVVVTVGPVAG